MGKETLRSSEWTWVVGGLARVARQDFSRCVFRPPTKAWLEGWLEAPALHPVVDSVVSKRCQRIDPACAVGRDKAGSARRGDQHDHGDTGNPRIGGFDAVELSRHKPA